MCAVGTRFNEFYWVPTALCIFLIMLLPIFSAYGTKVKTVVFVINVNKKSFILKIVYDIFVNCIVFWKLAKIYTKK